MCAMQRRPVENQPNEPTPPPPQEPRYRFRTALWTGVPITILLFLWFIRGTEIAFSFEDITSALDVVMKHRYVQLACLGIVCVAILLIVRVHQDR
jgi:hypothetical protein